jgi:hypothetical protein
MPKRYTGDDARDSQEGQGGLDAKERRAAGRMARAAPCGLPTVIRTAKGPLVTLPYTVEINDIAIMIVQHHESGYLAKRAIDQFDRLYAEGKRRAKIMALAIHRTASNTSKRSTIMRAASRACCTGTAPRSSTGTSPPPRPQRRSSRPSARSAMRLPDQLGANPRGWEITISNQ